MIDMSEKLHRVVATLGRCQRHVHIGVGVEVGVSILMLLKDDGFADVEVNPAAWRVQHPCAVRLITEWICFVEDLHPRVGSESGVRICMPNPTDLWWLIVVIEGVPVERLGWARRGGWYRSHAR